MNLISSPPLSPVPLVHPPLEGIGTRDCCLGRRVASWSAAFGLCCHLFRNKSWSSRLSMDLSFAAFYSTGLSRKMVNSKSRARSKRLVPFLYFAPGFSLCLSISVPLLVLVPFLWEPDANLWFGNISSKITPFPAVMLWIHLCVSVCPFDQGVMY